jgi:hypothetical protein
VRKGPEAEGGLMAFGNRIVTSEQEFCPDKAYFT